jgi:hypothetical protein
MPGEAVSAEPQDGEAVLELTAHPQLREILSNANPFFVDTATKQIEWRPGRPCEGDPYRGNPPCAGFAYELVYWQADGRINSFGVYDACGPPYYDCAATKPSAILAPGQAWMNLFGDDRVKDLMQNLDGYVKTRELKKE